MRYQKQHDDKETGLHYSRYRYYNPHGDSFIRRNPADYPV
ncbi:RHS repeat-associated core domain-containing protein [Mixta tenebrionis]